MSCACASSSSGVSSSGSQPTQDHSTRGETRNAFRPLFRLYGSQIVTVKVLPLPGSLRTALAVGGIGLPEALPHLVEILRRDAHAVVRDLQNGLCAVRIEPHADMPVLTAILVRVLQQVLHDAGIERGIVFCAQAGRDLRLQGFGYDAVEGLFVLHDQHTHGTSSLLAVFLYIPLHSTIKSPLCKGFDCRKGRRLLYCRCKQSDRVLSAGAPARQSTGESG